MNLRKLTKIVLLSAVFIFTPACLMFTNLPVASRLSVPYVDEIAEIVGSVTSKALVRNLDSEGNGEGEWRKAEIANGSGFFIGGGYFITANHVVTLPDYTIVRSLFGSYGVPREVKDRTWEVDGRKAIMIGFENDISVLYVDDFKNKKGIHVSPKPLEVGQQIAVYGRAYGGKYSWKIGVVSRQTGDPKYQPWEGDVYALFSIATNPGDSGSAVLSVEKDQIVCVGMITAGVGSANNYSTGYRGGYLRNVLRQIIRGE